MQNFIFSSEAASSLAKLTKCLVFNKITFLFTLYSDNKVDQNESLAPCTELMTSKSDYVVDT